MTYNSNRTTGAARTHIRKNTLAGAVSAAVVASALSTPAWSQTLEEVMMSRTW
jgi:hypothetical protein